ncbi:hypothetical protein M378DRAFT_170452 [Amanita muscaria Koide BX008]|uniref:Uncharacterized protein n=1 Tax=Amanita muscaria (strain Koide BX008) TaxID=946122 RepID=A0A0C2SWS3_AMAMK|nr:hypothetical protein M378DRAFT_170452 [Amanita muscaria Koide BX008]
MTQYRLTQDNGLRGSQKVPERWRQNTGGTSALITPIWSTAYQLNGFATSQHHIHSA